MTQQATPTAVTYLQVAKRDSARQEGRGLSILGCSANPPERIATDAVLVRLTIAVPQSAFQPAQLHAEIVGELKAEGAAVQSAVIVERPADDER